MAKNENVGNVDHKGKPSGNGRENETLQEATGEAQAINNLNNTTLEMRHHNRHLHKGENAKTFKDREE
jgi:hypothetical protein